MSSQILSQSLLFERLGINEVSAAYCELVGPCYKTASHTELLRAECRTAHIVRWHVAQCGVRAHIKLVVKVWEIYRSFSNPPEGGTNGYWQPQIPANPGRVHRHAEAQKGLAQVQFLPITGCPANPTN